MASIKSGDTEMWARKTHEGVFCVIGAHPFRIQRRHGQQRRVDTIEMPMKRAVVAGDDALPLLGDRRLSGSPSRTLGYGSGNSHSIWKCRKSTTEAENGGTIAVLCTIGITIFQLTMSTRRSQGTERYQRAILWIVVIELLT